MNKERTKLHISSNLTKIVEKDIQDIIEESIKENVYALKVSGIVNQNNPCKQKIKVEGFGIYDNKNPNKNDGKYYNRYYLEFHITSLIPKMSPSGTLLTLMMNPSWTFPDGKSIDSTVKNVIKIANKLKKAKVIILNTLPIIHSNKEIAIDKINKDKQKYNKNFIEKYLNKIKTDNTIFLAAWGSDKRINKYNIYSEKISKIFKKDQIKAISINADNTPMHPSPMPKNRESMRTFFSGEKNLIKVKLVKDSKVEEIKKPNHKNRIDK